MPDSSSVPDPGPPILGEPDGEIQRLSHDVGVRVRQARAEVRLSRRELSLKSGVSQRYLAQIEAGEGNISIGMLVKLGHALGIMTADLIRATEQSAESQQIARQFDHATPAQQKEIRRILGESQDKRARRIALIGLRGAGKSTLGKRLAERLEVPFVELNAVIEQQFGLAVADVIALYGPEGYRDFEQRALRHVIDSNDRVVLAVAGGIVSAPETYDLLLERCSTVWLRAAPQEHMERVLAQGDERPMAGNPRALDELKAILSEREPLYARAGKVLDTSRQDLDASEQDLLKLVGVQSV